MAKFSRKGKSKGTPPLSTASLPDIVFMLLFFFMVTTTMSDVELKVKYHLPKATEIKKLEKKSLVSYINVGPPIPAYQKLMGSEPRIQLNDRFAELRDIDQYITSEREKLSEDDRKMMTVSLKVDEKAKMGIVTDIKQELRKSQALKINYSTLKGVVKK